MPESVRRRYEGMAAAGELDPDAGQYELADRLDLVLGQLAAQGARSKKSALGWLLSRGAKPDRPRGLYIWGAVGRGKTLFMDQFFRAAPVERKRRAHFHAFMADVHDRLREARRISGAGQANDQDPLILVANAMADEVELLCFDEFAVHDIADAMILGRLFKQLFERGVTLVATSNVPPDELYNDGLNRALFVPFIEVLKAHADVFHLAARRDYRIDMAGSERRYVTPLGREADACLAAHFRHLTGLDHGSRIELAHRGRRIVVPDAAAGTARFSFEDLCAATLGPGDYSRIARSFNTLIVANIPALGPATRNEARRLINLIDTLYDNRIRLIVSAEEEPDSLWSGEGGIEEFEFARTASRLAEMRSDAYWKAAAPVQRKIKSARAL